jgi:hypothetical protein
MLSAISLLGQIATLLAKRLKSVNFNEAPDGRGGGACGSLTRLYYLLVDLKSLTGYISERAKFAVEHNNPLLFAFVLRNTKRRIQGGSNDFAETFYSLEKTLETFAPDMAGTLVAVANWKVNLLRKISESTVFEQDAEHLEVRKFKYLKPNERLLNFDADAYANQLKNAGVKQRAARFEWPDTLLYQGSLDNTFSPAELGFVDIEQLKELSSMLEQHRQVLDRGTLALKDYIKNTFTVDQILYENVEIAPEAFG